MTVTACNFLAQEKPLESILRMSRNGFRRAVHSGKDPHADDDTGILQGQRESLSLHHWR
jgi:hypothetical protein